MKKSSLGALAIYLPAGLGLSLMVVACGGSDGGHGQQTGGSAMTSGGSGTMASGGASTSTAGTSSKAGTSSTGNGGSTGNSGGDFMTGLPASTPLGSLTDAQSMQLCSSLENYFGASLKDFDCRLAGLIAAAFSAPDTDAKAQAACKTAYDECTAAPATSMGTCMKPTGTCTATVGDFEKCMSDEGAIFDQAGASLPACADLTLQDLMSSGGDMTQPMEPASCTALQMACPGAPTPPAPMP